MAYELLCGWNPFIAPSIDIFKKKIQFMDFNFETPEFKQVSGEAKEFIKSLLTERGSRLTAPQALEHPWIERAAISSASQESGLKCLNAL